MSQIGDWFPAETTYPGAPEPARAMAKTSLQVLLEVSRAEQRPRDFYSVHMPAWVAEEVAPHHVRVTVLREPVARTISHLRHIARAMQLVGGQPAFGSLQELYDDPRWHERLVNYQVRIFATTRAEAERAHDRRIASLPPGTRLPDGFLLPIMATGIEGCEPLGDDALERAIATLDHFDVVGVTEHLDLAFAQVAELVGREARPVGHINRGSPTLEASEELVEHVRADQKLDSMLYDHARAMALRVGERQVPTAEF